MKNIFKFMMLSLSFLPLFSCGGNSYEVNEEEWNEAVENIVNVKKSNKLNYTGTSDIDVVTIEKKTNDEEKMKLTSMSIDGNIQQMTAEEETEKATVKLCKDGPLYISVTDDVESGDFGITDLLNLFFDFYGNKQCFTYDANNKVYTCEEFYEKYASFKLKIAFLNKKINKIDMDYMIKDGSKKEITVKGYINFAYGQTDLTLTEDEKAIYNANYPCFDKDVTSVTFAPPGKGSTLGMSFNFKVLTKNNETRNGLQLKQNDEVIKYNYKDYSSTYLYFNDELLTIGDSSEDGDYYFDKTNHILYLNKSLNEGVLRMCLYTDTTVYHSQEVTATFTKS